MKLSTTPVRLYLGALVLFMTSGSLMIACEPFEDSFGAYFDSCNTGDGDVQVDGIWTITGEGTVYDCDDAAFDGDVTLKTRDLDVIQQADQSLKLSEPISVPGGTFNLLGSVEGSCVNFEAREISSQGTITYKFIGYSSLEGTDDIVGSFSVEGPGTCTGSGDFRVQVR